MNPDTSATNSPADATYAYNAVGAVDSMQYRNGLVTRYIYNDRSWLRMLQTTNSSGGMLARFDYDAAGPSGDWTERRLSPTGLRRQLVEFLNNSSRTNRYDYDPLRRLTRDDIVSSAGPTGTIRYDADPGAIDQGYDLVGNRYSRLIENDFGLSAAGVAEYAGHTFNSRDELDTGTSGLPALIYDLNGNTTGYGTASYFYDAENRLVKHVANGVTVLVEYDAEGNRVKKTVVSGGTTNVTKYLIEELNPTGYAQVAEEWLSLNSQLSTLNCVYVYGLDLISQKRGSTTSYYGYDGLGSVRYLSGSSGTVTDTYTYDAFGIQIASSGSTTNFYRYTGEQWDPDLGMYHLRARYYRPEIGRFWSMDTFEGTQTDPLSLHKYVYAHANGVNGVDPSGHEFNLIGQLATIAINGWTGAKTAYSVYNAYSRAKYTISLLEDLSTVVGAMFDEDPESDAVVTEMLHSYLSGALKSAAVGIVVSTVVGAVTGPAAGKVANNVLYTMGRAGIRQGGIQKAQEFYRIQKKRYAGHSFEVTVAGEKKAVRFDQNGWPDFSEFLYKGPGNNTVRIRLTGSRTGDFAAADARANFPGGVRPTGYTWHHHQQLGVMQLVKSEVHNPQLNDNNWHNGAIAIVKRVWGGYND